MSGECSKCGEHALECECERAKNTDKTILGTQPPGTVSKQRKDLTQNLDQYKELLSRYEKEPRYFDRQGKPLELLEWARLCEDIQYKILKQENVGKYFVSTVWVGLNMSYMKNLPMLIFETMIFFDGNENEKEENDPIAYYIDRYSTEGEAFKGHEKAVKIAKGEILVEDDVESVTK